jgi:hypothetical protein
MSSRGRLLSGFRVESDNGRLAACHDSLEVCVEGFGLFAPCSLVIQISNTWLLSSPAWPRNSLVSQSWPLIILVSHRLSLSTSRSLKIIITQRRRTHKTRGAWAAIRPSGSRHGICSYAPRSSFLHFACPRFCPGKKTPTDTCARLYRKKRGPLPCLVPKRNRPNHRNIADGA